MEAPHADTYPLPRPTGRRNLPLAYVALYVVFGGCALGYLATSALKPEIVSGLVASLKSDAGGMDRALTRTVTDLKGEAIGLRQNVGQLQIEVAKIRTEVQSGEERAGRLAGRIAVLEKAVVSTPAASTPAASTVDGAPVAIDAAPAVLPRKTVALKSSDARRAASAAAAAAKSAPAVAAVDLAPAAAAVPAATVGQFAAAQPAPGITVLNAHPAAAVPAPVSAAAVPAGVALAGEQQSMETGSIAAPARLLATRQAAAPTPVAIGTPVAFGKAVVTPTPAPAPKPLAVQLGSATSVDALRLSWSLLADRNGDALANLEPRYVAGAEADGGGYGLIAGPIKNSTEAKRVCKLLASRGLACRVSAFDGNAL